MPRPFSTLFCRKSDRRVGWAYVARQDDPLADAIVGATVSLPARKPPWIVVDHDFSRIIIARWPGRLLEVEIIDAVTSADERRTGGYPPLPYATYTRCVAVKVREEIPVAALFGDSGGLVCSILDAVSTIDRARAQKLAAWRSAMADAAYDRVWRRWLEAEPPSVAGEMRATVRDPDEALESWAGITSTGGASARSPVGSGLSLAHSELFRQAVALDSNAAYEDELEDDGSFLVAPWAEAGDALLDAVLAFGAPQLTSDSDRQILTKAWLEVMGTPTWR
jgi:hypothetical protein